MDKLRVLAVGAHPDDLEILCGGTLAKYAVLGHHVTMAHLTDGARGHTEMAPAELAAVRKREAEAAGAIIGAEVIGLGLPDAGLFDTPDTRASVVELVRQARPDVIITLSPDDYSADHVTTSRLVCTAGFLATAPLVETATHAQEVLCPVFFADTCVGLNFLPTHYVDITDTFEQKHRMLQEHKSQLRWLDDSQGMNALEVIEVTGRYRGLQAGVRYAEGFRAYSAWGRTTTRRLLP
jgi:N-acetylglucosamine malate deacetylase 1